MSRRARVPAVSAVVGVVLCGVVLHHWNAQRHETAWLRKQIVFTRLNERSVAHQLERERHRRIGGLVARLHRPVGEEMLQIFHRIPQQVTVQRMTATPERWMIAVVPHNAKRDAQTQTITFPRLHGASQ